jgi:DNA-directed RNA polymerase specialized sigma24 family protein
MNLHPSPDTIQELLDDARYKILIAGAKSGVHPLFSGLWNRPSKEIKITMYLNTRDRRSVEDTLQEAFLKAFHYLQFVDKPTFSARCCRTAIDSVLAIVGKKRVSPEAWMDWSVDGETWQHWKISDAMAESDERSLREERERHLAEAIRKLRPTLRSIVEKPVLHNRVTKCLKNGEVSTGRCNTI